MQIACMGKRVTGHSGAICTVQGADRATAIARAACALTLLRSTDSHFLGNHELDLLCSSSCQGLLLFLFFEHRRETRSVRPRSPGPKLASFGGVVDRSSTPKLGFEGRHVPLRSCRGLMEFQSPSAAHGLRRDAGPSHLDACGRSCSHSGGQARSSTQH